MAYLSDDVAVASTAAFDGLDEIVDGTEVEVVGGNTTGIKIWAIEEGDWV